MTRRPAGTTTSTPPSSNAGGLDSEHPRPRHSRGARPRDTFPSRRPRTSDCCSSGTRARGAADFQRGDHARRGVRRPERRRTRRRSARRKCQEVQSSPGTCTTLARFRRNRGTRTWRRRDDDARFSTRVAARARAGRLPNAGVASMRAGRTSAGRPGPNAREGVSRRGEWGFGRPRARATAATSARRTTTRRASRVSTATIAAFASATLALELTRGPPPRRARRRTPPRPMGRGRARRGPRARPTHGRARRRRLPRPLPRGPDQGGRSPHVHRRRPDGERARDDRARDDRPASTWFVLVVVRIRPGCRPAPSGTPRGADLSRDSTTSRRRGRARRLAHGKTERRRGRRRRPRPRSRRCPSRSISQPHRRPPPPPSTTRTIRPHPTRTRSRTTSRTTPLRSPPPLLLPPPRPSRLRRISRRTSLGGDDDGDTRLSDAFAAILSRAASTSRDDAVSPRARGARRRLRRRAVGGGDGRFDRSEFRRRDPK